jgi:glycosyltransferase involved in cell wall biosynthesis
MPVFNEIGTVQAALDDVLTTDLGVTSELVIVDDGSTDGTRELLREAELPSGVRLVLHERNQGKGAAIQTGLQHARGAHAAILDADLEYRAADLRALLVPLLDGTARVVFGVRAFDGYTSHSFLYVMGNRGVTLAANALFNVYLRDLMTCHKLIPTDVFRSLPLRESGFAIEAEITARLLQRGERIFEVPIHYRARASDEGKKLVATDGLRVLRTLVRCRLTPGRIA